MTTDEHNVRITNTGYDCSCSHSITTAVVSTASLLAHRHARLHKNSTLVDIREHPKGFRVKESWQKGIDATKAVRLDGRAGNG